MSRTSTMHVPLHSDGRKPIERILRFSHELELAEYEWNDRDGVATLKFEARNGALLTLVREQPASRRHNGWRTWQGFYT